MFIFNICTVASGMGDASVNEQHLHASPVSSLTEKSSRKIKKISEDERESGLELMFHFAFSLAIASHEGLLPYICFVFIYLFKYLNILRFPAAFIP